MLAFPSTELETHALRHENISTFWTLYGERTVEGVGWDRALRQVSAGFFLFLCFLCPYGHEAPADPP